MKKDLRLFAMVFLGLFCTQTLLAQSTKFVGNEGTLHYFELFDGEGKPIKMASEMGVNGSPMLLEGWASGVVRYKNGVVFADTAMNYSTFDNKIFYIENNKLYQIVLPVASFYLTYTKSGEAVNYHFKSGIPAIDDHDTSALYEVLYEGANLQLLQWNHKKVKELSNYGSSREKEFYPEKQLYLYRPKEQTITSIRPSLASLKKVLPAYAEMIQDYTKSKKLSVKTNDQMVDLVAYLDKQ